MRFIIEPSVLSISSHVSVAVVRVATSAEAKAERAVLNTLKADALFSLLDRIPSSRVADLEAIPSVQQWIKTYKAMSLKPKKIKPTHYALSSRLLKDRKWPRSIGPLVDTYLSNQIKNLMPHGGYDVAALSGDTIVLRVSEDEHSFQPLGVAEDDRDHIETTKPAEVLYLDQSSKGSVTLTRYWNYRDAEPTKIVDDLEDESKSTHDMVLFIESVDGSDEGKKRLKDAATDLEQAYRLVYGGSVCQSYVRIVEMAGQEVEVSLNF